MEELTSDSLNLINNPDSTLHTEKFKSPLPFDLVPSIDKMLDDNFTLEERKIARETRKILNKPDLQVSATAVRVPVLNCHSEAIYFEAELPLEYKQVVNLLSNDDFHVYGINGEDQYPTPRTISDNNKIHIGRIRVDPTNSHAGMMWIVSDNLRIGAALNALEIADQLFDIGL